MKPYPIPLLTVSYIPWKFTLISTHLVISKLFPFIIMTDNVRHYIHQYSQLIFRCLFQVYLYIICMYIHITTYRTPMAMIPYNVYKGWMSCNSVWVKWLEFHKIQYVYTLFLLVARQIHESISQGKRWLKLPRRSTWWDDSWWSITIADFGMYFSIGKHIKPWYIGKHIKPLQHRYDGLEHDM